MGRRQIPVPQALERALDTALDKALGTERPLVLAYLERLRARHPGATPAEIVVLLEKHYRAAVVAIGAASGSAAAVPAIGTAATVATAGAEIAAFVSATGMYVLALAELHRIPVSDPQIRRALVLGTLVGAAGTPALADVGAGGGAWAHVINRPDREGAVAALNNRLGRLLLTRFGTRQGALAVGRALPMGVGAGIGAVGNAALARGAIAAARRAFGAAPRSFGPRIIDLG
ncbi:MAG: hypothetical protein EPN43_02030 [Jatrophihabitans sp.]|nr:MAG: hypothetical protein EPN43_02030 [Jatrophihabitans sp.]